MRPLIGLTTYHEHLDWDGWHTEFSLLHGWYADAVEDAGGSPVLLPPQIDASEVVNRLDGLILTGGFDLDARLYGAVAHENNDPPRPARDYFETSAYRAARILGLPVLGICRGLQVMVVAEGGSLVQHLPEVTDLPHALRPGVFGEHVVTIAQGSRLEQLYGSEANVATSHHQAVRDPGALTPTAWAGDGVIEAVELPGDDLVVGVQWHPEFYAGGPLFEALVAAVKLAGDDVALGPLHPDALTLQVLLGLANVVRVAVEFDDHPAQVVLDLRPPDVGDDVEVGDDPVDHRFLGAGLRERQQQVFGHGKSLRRVVGVDPGK